MLRITVHDHPGTLTFQLEGSLAGPWLQVLEECWQETLARKSKPMLRIDLTGGLIGTPDRAIIQSKPMVRIDLTGVTFIDAAGRACLAAMHRQGAEFIAPDCLMKATVAEITQTPGRERGPLK